MTEQKIVAESYFFDFKKELEYQLSLGWLVQSVQCDAKSCWLAVLYKVKP
jgi:hypothetical protein